MRGQRVGVLDLLPVAPRLPRVARGRRRAFVEPRIREPDGCARHRAPARRAPARAAAAAPPAAPSPPRGAASPRRPCARASRRRSRPASRRRGTRCRRSSRSASARPAAARRLRRIARLPAPPGRASPWPRSAGLPRSASRSRRRALSRARPGRAATAATPDRRWCRWRARRADRGRSPWPPSSVIVSAMRSSGVTAWTRFASSISSLAVSLASLFCFRRAACALARHSRMPSNASRPSPLSSAR